MKRLLPLLVLPLALCTGCLSFFGITFDSEKPLAEPAQIPSGPDLSREFAEYGVFAVSADPSLFAETTRATDMGRGGLLETVGMVPLRAIAARGLSSLVERHFREPIADERPAFVLESSPQFISIRQDRKTARIKISVLVRCIKQDEDRTVLLAKTFVGERTGPWAKGQVPVALYEALNDVWDAFLREFRSTVRPATLMDGPESGFKLPELGNVSFESAKDAFLYDVVVGTCTMACNDHFGSAQTETFAKKQILKLCASHLGIEEALTGIRYDDKETKYDSATKTWRFRFSAWAKTRMALKYDNVYRKGWALVDLDLFDGTVEDAAKAAKEYIVREMNLRAGIYADDAPEAVADIRFGKMEHDIEKNRIVLPFNLVY